MRQRSPSKPYKGPNIRMDYKARRTIRRVLNFLSLIAFPAILTTITFMLMKTHVPIVDRPNFDMFLLNNLSPNRKIDWHDYEMIKREKQREGPGEQGKPVNYSNLPKDLVDSLYKLNGYNGAVSDIVSIDRAVPDFRHPNCKKKLYRSELPTVSVIIPFHNEHPSTLIRTGKSVINRAPDHLIKEIIYVDDYSSREPLKDEFDNFLKDNMPKARVIRLPDRIGLINARTAGAKAATGEVLMFLDAHVEAAVNYLPPLLDPIAEDYRTCVCPLIDVIDFDTYEYRPDSEGRGIFNWDLLYKRLPRLKDDVMKRPAEPFANPVMAGGLFAISTRFFWELGGYDDGLDIWGGEQYELSFKIWQCGGRMMDAPCSRIAHIYRKFGPFPNPRKTNFICVNYKRVAEVWMDEYKEYYYMRHPDCAKEDAGDLSKQKALREKLQCKPFKWFMEEVAFDLTKKYPPIEPPDVASGPIKSAGHNNLCVEILSETLEIRNCAPGYWAQKFRLSWQGDIQSGEKCWDISDYSSNTADIKFYPCHGSGGNQLWKYDPTSKQIIHRSEGRCLDMDVNTKKIFVNKCESTSKTQTWELQNFNATASADVDMNIQRFKESE